MLNTALIFDLLGHPIAPLGNGDLVVLGPRDQLRRVPLCATDWHVVDAARDQSRAPWLLTRHELFLLSVDGDRELGFALEAFGGEGVLSLLEVSESAARAQRRLFALNTVRGAYVVELDGNTLNKLNDEPIDFAACASVEQQGGVVLLGSSLRPADASGAPQPGRPALVQIETGANHSRARAPLPLASLASQVIDKLAAAPHRLSRDLAAQAVPELIVATAGDRFLVGLTALPDRLDPADELAPRPMSSEMIGLALVSAQGQVIDVALHIACLGVWRAGDGVERALLTTNRGRGGMLGELSTLVLGPSCESFEGRVGVDVKAAGIADVGSLRCRAFRPRHHVSVGSFGVARIGEPDRADRAAVLVERDDRRWDVIADETSGPLPLAPLSNGAASR